MTTDPSDIGNIGERAVMFWCSQARIAATKPEKDAKGWDLFLELPQARRRSVSFDLEPGELSCKVQVKTTTTDKTSESIKLSNWRRMITDPLPWFVIVVVLRDLSPIEAYVVHVDEHWTGKVLKRLRTLEAQDKLHKRSLAVTWTREQRLPEWHGQALDDALRKHIGDDLLVYATRKQKWNADLGWDDPRPRTRITTAAMPADELHDAIVDFVVGLRETLPVSKVEVEASRFGITKTEEIPVDGTQQMRVTDRPSLGTTTVRFARHDSSASVELRCETYDSASYVPGIPDAHRKKRLVSGLVSLVLMVKQHGDQRELQVQFTIETPLPGTRYSLQSIAEAAALSSLMASGKALHWEVRKEDGTGFERDDFQSMEVPTNLLEYYRVFERAHRIASHFGLPRPIEVDPEVLVPDHEAISMLDDALAGSKRVGRFSAEVGLAAVPSFARAAMLLCPTVHLGEHAVSACVALVGVPELHAVKPGVVRIEVGLAEARVLDEWPQASAEWSESEALRRVAAARKELEAEGIELIISADEPEP